jgi:hypothetical protein
LAIALLASLLTLAFLFLTFAFALLLLAMLLRAFRTMRAVLTWIRLIAAPALLAPATRLVLLFPVFVLLHLASFHCSVRRYADMKAPQDACHGGQIPASLCFTRVAAGKRRFAMITLARREIVAVHFYSRAS